MPSAVKEVGRKETSKKIAPDLKKIGKRVRALREKYMLTQTEMAGKLLVSRYQLSEIENGKRMPSGPLLLAMEYVFNTSKDWILSGKGEMIMERDVLSTGEDTEADIVELFKGFRALSQEGKKKLMNILRVFLIVEKNGPYT